MSAADLAEVPAARRAGVAEDIITASWQQHARTNRKPRALSAREGLLALQFEATLVWTAAANLRNGETLDDEDFKRLTLAAQRIDTIVDEVAR